MTKSKAAKKLDATATTFAAVMDPTSVQFTAYSKAFDYFNRELFGGKLPPVLLNLSRMNKARGFYMSNAWGRDGAKLPEISLNPMSLSVRTLKQSMSTLVHEMAHHWQFVFGKPGRGGYHNAEWAAKMDEIGLCPTATGEIGGPRTGDRVTHAIVAGGPFCRAFDKMHDAAKLPLSSFDFERAAKSKRKPSKVRYTCPACMFNAWAKPEACIMCGDCEEHMVCEPPDEDDEAGDRAA